MIFKRNTVIVVVIKLNLIKIHLQEKECFFIVSLSHQAHNFANHYLACKFQYFGSLPTPINLELMEERTICEENFVLSKPQTTHSWLTFGSFSCITGVQHCQCHLQCLRRYPRDGFKRKCKRHPLACKMQWWPRIKNHLRTHRAALIYHKLNRREWHGE